MAYLTIRQQHAQAPGIGKVNLLGDSRGRRSVKQQTCEKENQILSGKYCLLWINRCTEEKHVYRMMRHSQEVLSIIDLGLGMLRDSAQPRAIMMIISRPLIAITCSLSLQLCCARHSTLRCKLNCATFHRLGEIARTDGRGFRARNARVQSVVSGFPSVKVALLADCIH